jgi:hypothetical protein
MKTKDVHTGETYLAKVSGNLVPVTILGTSPLGGWNAVNTQTSRNVRIKSPQRLRYNLTIQILIMEDGDLRNLKRPNQAGDEPSVQRAYGLKAMQEANKNPGEPVYR